jgi:large subunit ribosomal protein L18
MGTRKAARLRRAGKTRARVRRLRTNRLCVFRSSQHVYAQIIEPSGGRVLVSASTTERELREQIGYGGNVGAAAAVGKRLAEKAKDAGVRQVAFDRSGYKYHGRIKALADAAREGGLEF